METIFYNTIALQTFLAEHFWYICLTGRAIAGFTDGSQPSVINLNCQRTFKKPLVMAREVTYREL
jgi:hypothetical protein